MVEDIKSICEDRIIGAKCRESFFHPKLPKSPLSDFLLGGVSDLKPPYQIIRDDPRFHLVLATLSGKGELFVDNNCYDLSAGSVFIARSDSAYRYRLPSGSWKIAWFHLYPTKRWQRFANSPFQVLTFGRTAGFYHILEQCTDLEKNHSVHDIPLFRSYLQVASEYLDAISFLGEGRKVDDRMIELWDRVDSHIDHHWNIRKMARLIHVSTSQLHRLCHEVYRMSPMKKLTEKRMKVARALLLETSGTLRQISEQVGYSDEFAFSVAYKRYWGMSPGGVRKKVLKGV